MVESFLYTNADIAKWYQTFNNATMRREKLYLFPPPPPPRLVKRMAAGKLSKYERIFICSDTYTRVKDP